MKRFRSRSSFVAVAIVLAGGALPTLACTTETQVTAPAEAIDCEVAVVGGGAGGTHTAFRLASTLNSRVCLFEKDAELGGRIHDIASDEANPGSQRIGVGARRVMETQKVLFDLAAELGLELEKPDDAADFLNARKTFSFSKDEIWKKAYASLPAPTTPETDQETFLYDTLRKGPERANVTKYPNFEAYVRKVVGDEGYNFLRDVSRFRADFEYPLDARGYLDYLDEEWDTCCAPSYPKGGMSSFIRGMEARAVQGGARIFKQEPVTRIDKAAAGYTLTTDKHTVKAAKVVLAVPPYGLDKIAGDVPDRIKAQPQYQQIAAVRVVTITQFWNESWWKAIKNPAANAKNPVWRAWTTEHCLNFIEIPIEPYADAQKVTRSVYVDNLKCVTFWEDLLKQGQQKVEDELQRGLEALLSGNGVTTPATLSVPKPKRTVVQVWPDAWHWLKAGATVTNAQHADWAVAPLGDEPVALVGEAYYVNRSGWSDGAYKSSIKLLNAKYGMKLPGLAPQGLGTGSFVSGSRPASHPPQPSQR